MVKYLTILLSISGLAVGVWAVSESKVVPLDVPLAREASVNPFGRGIASLGILEPGGGTAGSAGGSGGKVVNVVAPQPGLVAEVFVDVGDKVEAGEPLFQLDARILEADLVRAKAAVPAAQAEIERWKALPRAEDVPPLESAVRAAEARLKERQEVLRFTEAADRSGASTQRDLVTLRLGVDENKAGLERATADLAKLKAGGWAPDLMIFEANLAQRNAEVAALETLIARQTVRAPKGGTILRRSVEPGEYALTDPTRSAFILGDLSTLNVRAQVDEEDLALLPVDTSNLRAVARTRGSVVRDIPVTLVRVEPFARPKTDLTGANIERTDTRVIDVVFQMQPPPDLRLVPGQAVDVYIDGGIDAGK